MTDNFPGPKTLDVLKRGIPIFKNGLRFEEEMQKATERGYRSPRQIVISKASGDYIWDMDGKRYIDFQNGWATNPVGNAHPEIIEAVYEAQKQFGFHYDHPLRYDLAEKLTTIMPNESLTRINYEVSGTEAAEAAVHLALTHTKRRYIITFTSCFHGESLGTKLISGYSSEKNRYLEAWTGGVIKAPYPYSDETPANMTQDQYIDYCLWYLEKHIPDFIAPKDNIAGILVEPGLAEGGNWIPPTKFMQGIRDICNKNDWLMVVDEVLTGLGRTGKMWAIEHYDVQPDIMVMGKNLSGGIEPCAAIAARDDILGDCPEFSSGSTFAGTPAGCAAALKTLEIYERDGLVENAAKLGRIAADIMNEWTRYPIVKEIRSNGLLMGVGFQSPDGQDDNWLYARAARGRMLQNGVWAICDRDEAIRMYPALNMSEENLREGLAIMEDAIKMVSQVGHDEGDGPAWPTGVAGF